MPVRYCSIPNASPYLVPLLSHSERETDYLLMHYVAVSNQFPVVDTSFVIRDLGYIVIKDIHIQTYLNNK